MGVYRFICSGMGIERVQGYRKEYRKREIAEPEKRHGQW